VTVCALTQIQYHVMDRQTDRQNIVSLSRVTMLMRDKNGSVLAHVFLSRHSKPPLSDLLLICSTTSWVGGGHNVPPPLWPWPLTFWPWKWYPSHVLCGLPLCQI